MSFVKCALLKPKNPKCGDVINPRYGMVKCQKRLGECPNQIPDKAELWSPKTEETIIGTVVGTIEYPPPDGSMFLIKTEKSDDEDVSEKLFIIKADLRVGGRYLIQYSPGRTVYKNLASGFDADRPGTGSSSSQYYIEELK